MSGSRHAAIRARDPALLHQLQDRAVKPLSFKQGVSAARDGVFLRQFGKLHPRYHFPHVALIVMCVKTAAGSFFSLSTVINMLIAVIVLIQGIGLVAALTVLRRRQPELKRPYRMWLYPLPSIIAALGRVYVYYSTGLLPILLSLGWVAAGVVAYLLWARYVEHTWPFGPKEIMEEYLHCMGRLLWP